MSVDTATPATIQSDLEQLKLSETANGTASLKERPINLPKPAPRKLPFVDPAPTATRPTRAKLSTEEQSKYDVVLEHMKSIESLPISSSKKNKETAPLSEIEKCFLTKECILRYLRATKWNVNDAKKRLEVTIVWRREYGTDTLAAETVEPEVHHPPCECN